VQLLHLECEREEIVDAYVEAQDRAELPLPAEFNEGNLGQLADRDSLHLFKPEIRSDPHLLSRTGRYLQSTNCLWWTSLADGTAVGANNVMHQERSYVT